jgi:hypothetical protein
MSWVDPLIDARAHVEAGSWRFGLEGDVGGFGEMGPQVAVRGAEHALGPRGGAIRRNRNATTPDLPDERQPLVRHSTGSQRVEPRGLAAGAPQLDLVLEPADLLEFCGRSVRLDEPAAQEPRQRARARGRDGVRLRLWDGGRDPPIASAAPALIDRAGREHDRRRTPDRRVVDAPAAARREHDRHGDRVGRADSRAARRRSEMPSADADGPELRMGDGSVEPRAGCRREQGHAGP